ncbi:hypothetical protein IW140_003784 [Coemansia sp. RSA 1813]|nr:hypothetical protein EV179_004088 [Coemansia sp. RSA 487]KAJ2568578.1 hypothetical protein IW140_003784 [Coemansia sp. RSA 1813]
MLTVPLEQRLGSTGPGFDRIPEQVELELELEGQRMAGMKERVELPLLLVLGKAGPGSGHIPEQVELALETQGQVELALETQGQVELALETQGQAELELEPEEQILGMVDLRSGHIPGQVLQGVSALQVELAEVPIQACHHRHG